MANVDKAYGFKPVYRIGGGEPTVENFEATSSVAIYPGDVVQLVAGGTVTAGTAGQANAIAGVSMDYIGASDSDRTISVCIDPFAVFQVQSSTGTALAATDIGAAADHVAGSGSTYSVGYDPERANLNGYSGHELNSTVVTGGSAQFIILGLADTPGNAWGEHADVLVKFNEHRLLAEANGV